MRKNTVKVTVEVDEEFWRRVYSDVPWGMRRRLMIGIMQLILDSLDSNGEIMLGAIISGQCRLVLDLDGKDANASD